MQVVVRPAAAADIDSAYHWYERQRPGLGTEFLGALGETMRLVLIHPEAAAVLHRETRRVLVGRRFPFGLFYRLHGDVVVIVACMHAKRHDRQWRARR